MRTILLISTSISLCFLSACAADIIHQSNQAKNTFTTTSALLSDQQVAISKLSFLVGHWAGSGVFYGLNGKKESYFDTEYVRFDLEKKLLLINAHGQNPNGETTYSLHTVIFYDANTKTYIYTPYSGQQSPRAFQCRLNNKPQLTCYNQDKTYRLTFQRLADERWNEFGERLIDGEWVKNFETKLPAASTDH